MRSAGYRIVVSLILLGGTSVLNAGATPTAVSCPAASVVAAKTGIKLTANPPGKEGGKLVCGYPTSGEPVFIMIASSVAKAAFEKGQYTPRVSGFGDEAFGRQSAGPSTELHVLKGSNSVDILGPITMAQAKALADVAFASAGGNATSSAKSATPAKPKSTTTAKSTPSPASGSPLAKAVACNASAKLPLRAGSASEQATVQSLAESAAGDFCNPTLSSTLAVKLKAIEAVAKTNLASAETQLRALIAQANAGKVHARRQLARSLGCSGIDATMHLSDSTALKIEIAVAKFAQFTGLEGLDQFAESFIPGTLEELSQDATGVADHVEIAEGAQAFGLDKLADDELSNAASTANALASESKAKTGTFSDEGITVVVESTTPATSKCRALAKQLSDAMGASKTKKVFAKVHVTWDATKSGECEPSSLGASKFEVKDIGIGDLGTRKVVVQQPAGITGSLDATLEAGHYIAFWAPFHCYYLDPHTGQHMGPVSITPSDPGPEFTIG